MSTKIVIDKEDIKMNKEEKLSILRKTVKKNEDNEPIKGDP